MTVDFHFDRDMIQDENVVILVKQVSNWVKLILEKYTGIKFQIANDLLKSLEDGVILCRFLQVCCPDQVSDFIGGRTTVDNSTTPPVDGVDLFLKVTRAIMQTDYNLFHSRDFYAPYSQSTTIIQNEDQQLIQTINVLNGLVIFIDFLSTTNQLPITPAVPVRKSLITASLLPPVSRLRVCKEDQVIWGESQLVNEPQLQTTTQTVSSRRGGIKWQSLLENVTTLIENSRSDNSEVSSISNELFESSLVVFVHMNTVRGSARVTRKEGFHKNAQSSSHSIPFVDGSTNINNRHCIYVPNTISSHHRHPCHTPQCCSHTVNNSQNHALWQPLQPHNRMCHCCIPPQSSSWTPETISNSSNTNISSTLTDYEESAHLPLIAETTKYEDEDSTRASSFESDSEDIPSSTVCLTTTSSSSLHETPKEVSSCSGQSTIVVGTPIHQFNHGLVKTQVTINIRHTKQVRIPRTDPHIILN